MMGKTEKNLERKSRNLSDQNTKNQMTKIWDERDDREIPAHFIRQRDKKVKLALIDFSKQCNSGFGVRILPFSQFLEKSISSNGIGGNKTKGQ